MDLAFTVDALADRMRNDFGFGRSRDVAAALELSKIARLASETPHGWEIYFRNLGSISREISQALLHEDRSTANKTRPIRTAREVAAAEGEDGGQQGLFNEDAHT